MSAREAETLRAARKLIERPEDWCQGSFEHSGRYCVLGALQKACGVHRLNAEQDDNYRAARQRLYQVLGSGSIVYWNDISDRSHAEALRAMDRAIAWAEALP